MNHINGALKKLIASHSFFLTSRTTFRLFMTLFIWNLTGSIRDIALFEIVFLVTHSLFFHIFAPYAKKGHIYTLRNFGMIGTGIFFLLLFHMGDTAANHIAFLAFIYAIPNSAYWLSHHTINFDLTHLKNRANYAAQERAAKTFVQLLTPVIGGYLITANVLGLGYGNIFIFGALAISGALAFGNIHIPEKNSKEEFNFRETLRHVWEDGDFRKVILSGALNNFGRVGVLKTILPVFLLVALGTELEVGGWVSFFAFLSILTTLIIGKRIHYKYLKNASLLGGFGISASLALLTFSPGLFAYIVYGSVQKLLSPVSMLARRVYYQNLLHRLKDHKKHRIEYLVIREWANVGIGRVVGFVPLLFVKDLTSGILISLFTVMAIALLIEPLIVRSIKTDITTLK